MMSDFPRCWETFYMGTKTNDMSRGNAEARNVEGWEQLVKTTASEVIDKLLIVCNKCSKMVG